ncbi:unnamed protein product, partial [Ectocarpus fasciculatus]
RSARGGKDLSASGPGDRSCRPRVGRRRRASADLLRRTSGHPGAVVRRQGRLLQGGDRRKTVRRTAALRTSGRGHRVRTRQDLRRRLRARTGESSAGRPARHAAGPRGGRPCNGPRQIPFPASGNGAPAIRPAVLSAQLARRRPQTVTRIAGPGGYRPAALS